MRGTAVVEEKYRGLTCMPGRCGMLRGRERDRQRDLPIAPYSNRIGQRPCPSRLLRLRRRCCCCCFLSTCVSSTWGGVEEEEEEQGEEGDNLPINHTDTSDEQPTVVYHRDMPTMPSLLPLVWPSSMSVGRLAGTNAHRPSPNLRLTPTESLTMSCTCISHIFSDNILVTRWFVSIVHPCNISI